MDTYNIVPRSNGHWAIVKYKNQRASRVMKKYTDAYNYVFQIIISHGGIMYVHGRDGSIKLKISVKYEGSMAHE